jgi:hypothetical protein
MEEVIRYTHFGRDIELPIGEVETAEKNHNPYGSSLVLHYADGNVIKASGNHDFIEMMYTTAVAISNSYQLGYEHGYSNRASEETRDWYRRNA